MNTKHKTQAITASSKPAELTVHAVGLPAHIVAYAIAFLIIAVALAYLWSAAKVGYISDTSTTTKTENRTRLSMGEK